MSGAPDNKAIDFAGGTRISTLPDGTVLQFPPNTPRDVQDRVYQKKLGEWMVAENERRAKIAATPQVGGPEAFGIGTTQGLLANFGDEAASAIGATIGRPGGEPLPGETWGERYDNALDISRTRQNAAKDQHPYAYGAGQVTGAVAPAVVAPALSGAKYIAGAGSMAGMMARSAGVGGAYGAVQGFGAGENGFSERAKDAAVGGATGAAIGAAIPPVMKAGGAAAKWAKNTVGDWLWPKLTITEPAPAAVAGVADAAAAPPTSIQVAPSDVSKAVSKIGEALRRDGYSEQQVSQILNALGPKGTLADVGENTKQLLVSAMGSPGAGKQIGKTILENRQAAEQSGLAEAAEKAIGGAKGNIYDSVDAIIAQRKMNAGPAYDAFYASDPAQYNTEFMQRLLSSDMGKELLGRAKTIYELERLQGKAPGALFDDVLDAEGNVTGKQFQTRVLDYVKQAIDSKVEDYIDPLTKKIKGPVGNAWDGLRREFLSDIDNVNPLYSNARAAYSGPAKSLEAIEAGRAFIKSDAEEITRDIANLQKGDIELFRQGALRGILDIIKSKPADVSVVQLLRKSGLLEKVQAIAPTKEQFNSFVQDLTNARRFAGTRAAATGGSQTAEKLLGAMDLADNPVVKIGGDLATGNKAGLVSRALDWMGQLTGPGEETRAAIVKALLSNDRTEIDQTIKSALMAQALSRAGNQAVGTVAVGGAPTAAMYGNALMQNKGGPR